MDEADLRRVLAHPRTMIGSDGIPGPYPHPRLWAASARAGPHARELGLLTLEDAVPHDVAAGIGLRAARARRAP
ncbi:hypothetical protein ACU4GH_31395 [Bradyrhizobium betae]